MTPAEKRQHELKAVIELLRWRALDVKRIVQRERPDFEVQLADGSTVGIEVTELADDALARGAAILKLLQKELVQELEVKGVTKGVHLGIPEGFALLLGSRDVRARNVKALVDLAVENQAAEGMLTIEYDALVARGVQFILEATFSDSGAVTTGHSATGRRAPSVQEGIDAKNEKAPEYRVALPHARELWLLLLSGVDFRSGVWSAVVEGHEYVSAFDRTFCIDAYENKFIELRTRRSEIAGGA